jgi:hypothetical protein
VKTFLLNHTVVEGNRRTREETVSNSLLQEPTPELINTLLQKCHQYFHEGRAS